MKKFGLLIMMIAMTLQVSPVFAATLAPADEALLRSMPLRKKLGQMFIIGFKGKAASEELNDTISTLSPGGLIVFGRNIESAPQLSELLQRAQIASFNAVRAPLLIGTDQEGGDVIRIQTATPLPSALALGSAANPELTESAGYATGQLLKTLGFNMNFAPVLDVNDPTKPAFIGTRTFGEDPELVGRMGVSFATGLSRAGVLPTGKHFPGHGGIAADSHTSMPQKDISLEDLRATDLVPFKAMTTSFGDKTAMMLAHIAYPQIDKSRTPATFSKPIVTGLLRDEMKFDGLVVTDDISMEGAGSIKSVRERVIRTVEAGADMVMVAWNKRLQHELLNGLEQAVTSGRIKQERIDASVRRILSAKRTYAASRIRKATPDELRLAVQNPKFIEIGEATLKSRLQREADPAETAFREFAQKRPVLVFSANPRFAQTFKDSIKKRSVSSFGFNVQDAFDVDKVMRANPKAVGVFYVSGTQAARIAAKIGYDSASRMLLVTIEAPGLLPNADSFRYIADVYYRHPFLGRMIGEHYFPETPLTNETLRQPASSKPRAKTVGLSKPPF